jgi:hypothetical protein
MIMNPSISGQMTPIPQVSKDTAIWARPMLV